MSAQPERPPQWMPAVLLLFLLVGAALASAAWKAWVATPRPPAVGERAPLFVLPDLQNGSFGLEQWRGRRVLLVFWAPWSAPALAQAKTLRHASAPDDVMVVDVVLDYIDMDEVRGAVGPASASRIHLLGRPTELAPWGNFPTLPATWVLDREGRVVATREGYLDKNALERLVRP